MNTVFDLIPEYDLEIEVTDFPSVFAGLNAGSYQIGVNNFSYNEERAESYLYEEIYSKKDRSYFEALEKKAEEIAKKYDCRFADNETPYERVPQGHPTIVDYFYHEEVRGTANSGRRNRKTDRSTYMQPEANVSGCSDEITQISN